jgi:hypothetical protein
MREPRVVEIDRGQRSRGSEESEQGRMHAFLFDDDDVAVQ